MTAPARTEHPWLAFLEARIRVIEWMASEGRTEQEILQAMNMDAIQLVLLKMTLADCQVPR